MANASDFVILILGRTSQEWEGRFPDELKSGRAGFSDYDSPQTLVANLEAFDSSPYSFDAVALRNSTRVILCLVDSCEVSYFFLHSFIIIFEFFHCILMC